ncbi:MAG: uroporphyrinogen-III C-methyltransferase [Alphaproteobacteria bacterium CG11_big_fil_rev_8_21_14_0_20_44_7]|nr:MAG: uroporphyrinogen-III C-methyltransferase [Alphaproteobacteria bacterium CG11_big_fil_rev_8_21_14_0_20_44_7]
MEKKVYLIGAGPGDPELLTLKAARILTEADAVLYDNLISPSILKLIPDTAEKIYVGKSKSNHTLKQEEINALLIELAGKYSKVIRLKGGDPFIFGRGGEEVEALAAAEIGFEVVPGITAAQACGALLGIPLTHRDFVSGVHFFTGHGCHDIEPGLDWDILASEDKTLCIYMGLTNISMICERLAEHGMDKNTDAVVVENGSLPNQRHVFCKLAELPKKIEDGAFKSPALVIIGKVVGFARDLQKPATQT